LSVEICGPLVNSWAKEAVLPKNNATVAAVCKMIVFIGKNLNMKQSTQ